jgi:hypothetical protein
MLYYGSQTVATIIGTKAGTTRTSAALTTSYADNSKTLKVGGYSKVNLDVLYTTGAAETNNSVEIKFEGSPDGTNFYQTVNESVSGGTSTLALREFAYVGASAATAYSFSIGLDIFYKYLKISVKESGVAANAGSVYVEATLSGQ